MAVSAPHAVVMGQCKSLMGAGSADAVVAVRGRPKAVVAGALPMRLMPQDPGDHRVIIAWTRIPRVSTASHLGRLLKEFPGLTVSRLASGIPMGEDLGSSTAHALHTFAGRTSDSAHPPLFRFAEFDALWAISGIKLCKF